MDAAGAPTMAQPKDERREGEDDIIPKEPRPPLSSRTEAVSSSTPVLAPEPSSSAKLKMDENRTSENGGGSRAAFVEKAIDTRIPKADTTTMPRHPAEKDGERDSSTESVAEQRHSRQQMTFDRAAPAQLDPSPQPSEFPQQKPGQRRVRDQLVTHDMGVTGGEGDNDVPLPAAKRSRTTSMQSIDKVDLDSSIGALQKQPQDQSLVDTSADVAKKAGKADQDVGCSDTPSESAEASELAIPSTTIASALYASSSSATPLPLKSEESGEENGEEGDMWQKAAIINSENVAAAHAHDADGGSSNLSSDGSDGPATPPTTPLAEQEDRDIIVESGMAGELLVATGLEPSGLNETSKRDCASAGDANDVFARDVGDDGHKAGEASPSSSVSSISSFEPPPVPPSTPASDYQEKVSAFSESKIYSQTKPPLPPPPFYDDMVTPLPDANRPVGPPPPPRPPAVPAAGQPETSETSQPTDKRRGGAAPATSQRKPPAPPKIEKDHDFADWDVGDRYELMRILGRGSYGEVAQAKDLHSARKRPPTAGADVSSKCSFVAIKRITSAFDQEVDAVRLFREMHILRRLRGHECIIQLLDVIQSPSDGLNEFRDLYLVFEYVDTDLYKLIMSPQYLTTEHIQTFLYQMLTALKYIHSFSVIHRDLKPANILLNEDCSLKICDFGLARIVNSATMASSNGDDTNSDSSALNGESPSKTPPSRGLTRQLTKHVVTRWYRAPELILIQPYTSAVDIWSCGCILAELLSMQEGSVPGYQDRVPLFPGGSCYPLSGEGASVKNDERLDQLSVIFSVIGTPSAEDLESIGKATEYIKTLQKKRGRSIESMYPAADPAAIDLLKKMLRFNPRKRCTAEEALEHEFLRNVRRKEMERSADQPLIGPDFLETNKIDMSVLKTKTSEEIMWYRKPKAGSGKHSKDVVSGYPGENSA